MEETPKIHPQMDFKRFKTLLENAKGSSPNTDMEEKQDIAEAKRSYELLQEKYRGFLQQLENDKIEIRPNERNDDLPVICQATILAVTGAAISFLSRAESTVWFDIGVILTLIGVLQIGWIFLQSMKQSS